MWRPMDDAPTDRPFGVVTRSGRRRTARIRNGRLRYLEMRHCLPNSQRRAVRQDPPLMRWDGPLPIPPDDLQRVVIQQCPTLSPSPGTDALAKTT